MSVQTVSASASSSASASAFSATKTTMTTSGPSSTSNICKRQLQAQSLLPELKINLGPALIQNVPDKQLLKFLHWKPNVQRAADRFRAHVQWRKDNPWAFDYEKKSNDENNKNTTTSSSTSSGVDAGLRISKDDQLKKLLKSEFVIAPDTILSKPIQEEDDDHNDQGGGCPIIIGRLRKNDMTDGRTPQDVCRTILYLIDQILDRRIEAQLNGIIIFHDLNKLSRHNLHPMVPRLLIKGLIGHFPIRIRGIYLLNPPLFFRGLFTTVKTLFFPKKLKERSFYIKDVEDIWREEKMGVVDRENLLVEHGGDLDYDVHAWVDRQELLEKREEEIKMKMYETDDNYNDVDFNTKEEEDGFGSLHSCCVSKA